MNNFFARNNVVSVPPDFIDHEDLALKLLEERISRSEETHFARTPRFTTSERDDISFFHVNTQDRKSEGTRFRQDQP